jgi:pilus assembly protein Flp/PilA
MGGCWLASVGWRNPGDDCPSFQKFSHEGVPNIKTLLRRVWAEEEGATMVEYGVMVALIAAVSIVIIGVLGGKVQAAFQAVSDAMP